jgi:hypothetical protein
VREWRRAAPVIGAALLLACTPSDDMEEMVRDALKQANVGEVEVHRDANTVHLTGTVDTLADRSRAEELAAAIVGTAGRVSNEIAVTGLGPLESSESNARSSTPEDVRR